jgi:hypothetical protein
MAATTDSARAKQVERIRNWRIRQRHKTPQPGIKLKSLLSQLCSKQLGDVASYCSKLANRVRTKEMKVAAAKAVKAVKP